MTPEPLQTIEQAGRTCYKSEDKITDGSAEKFIKMLLERGHEAMIEHASASYRVICDRGVTHEIVRHRLFSYAQECVVGETKVHKDYTIEQLYNRQENGDHYDRTHNKTIRLKSVDVNNMIVPNRIRKIFYKGKQIVYKVKTKLGYVISCTLSHEFLNEGKVYKRLETFNVGDKLFTNGRPCLLKIDDKELSRLYLEEKLPPQEISDMFGVANSSVSLRLHKLGIFKSHLNDKNKEKYTKNHTKESYQKMQKTILDQYVDGRKPWNVGLKENDHPGVKNQAQALRNNHHNNGLGELNSNWSGGPSGNVLAQKIKEDIDHCELCNSKICLEVHHKDKNIYNNFDDNLIKVCSSCHKMLDHGWHLAKKAQLDEIVEISFMGEKNTFDIEMQSPYHNYIADGFVVHNSTRYCNYKSGVTFIIPPWLDIDEGDYSTIIVRETEHYWWSNFMAEAEARYQYFINEENWTPQQARSVLPNSLKTEIVITGNFREWQYFFKLRCAKTAHPQMQEVANMILTDIQKRVPIIFDEYSN
ncbi:MAG: FAD-dependent thymidylate synthase [Candidatus Heimdallarchaeaceae archaeon]